MEKADHQLLHWESSKKEQMIPININELASWADFRLSSAVQSLYSRKYRIYITKIKRK